MSRSKGRTGRPWRRLQQWVWANFSHCYRCGEYVDQTIPNPRDRRARSVDHIVPLHLGGDELSRDNAVLAHYGCNSSHGARMRHGKGTPMLTVVTGPPCSGKTTYVRQHAQPGDVVIDYDLIAQALGSPDPHDHPDTIAQITRAARRAAIDAALTCRGTVWIVETNISASKQRTYEQTGATFVVLDASRDVLHQRANAERPRVWHKLIDEWQAPNVAAVQPAASTSRAW